MKELQKKVVQWAEEKGLLNNVTPERIEAQTLKVLEEIGETAGAYLKGNKEEIVDGIGDVAVTLIILNAMIRSDGLTVDYECEYANGLSHLFDILDDLREVFEERYQFSEIQGLYNSLTSINLFAQSCNYELKGCLQSAYDVISKRKGKMVGDTFIKD